MITGESLGARGLGLDSFPLQKHIHLRFRSTGESIKFTKEIRAVNDIVVLAFFLPITELNARFFALHQPRGIVEHGVKAVGDRRERTAHGQSSGRFSQP